VHPEKNRDEPRSWPLDHVALALHFVLRMKLLGMLLLAAACGEARDVAIVEGPSFAQDVATATGRMRSPRFEVVFQLGGTTQSVTGRSASHAIAPASPLHRSAR
jgi:hypothetical protein